MWSAPLLHRKQHQTLIRGVCVAVVVYSVLFSVALCFAESSTRKKRIVVFTPTTANNTYWPQVYRIWDAVAADLNISIEKYEFDINNRFAKRTEGIEILKSIEKPDAAIFSVAFGQSKPLLDVAEKLNIPVILQGPISEDELKILGTLPREKYKSWIAYFYQDESQKGYLLAKSLIHSAKEKSTYAQDGSVHVIGIGGDRTWQGSNEREGGLLRAVQESRLTMLRQTIPTQWTTAEAQEKTSILLQRYPETSVVWTASDQLGIGASRALENTGYVVGENVFVGGLDLSRKGLLSIKNKKLSYTVSSTMFLYAEILIYLHDYLSGIDFKDEIGTEIKTSIEVVGLTNVNYYLRLYDSLELIDFKNFSKVYNKELQRYDFSNYFK